MKIARVLSGTLLAATLVPFAASAASYDEISAIADAAEKGRAIALEGDARNTGYQDTEATMKMVLINRKGQQSERELRMRTLENADPADGDKTMIIFDKPRDVAGTALLTFAHINDDDDQWIFFPVNKKVKRISSANKSGPFMGSEFSYEDFSSSEVEKFSYTWLADEPCPVEEVKDRTCAKVERVPVYENSGYTKQVAWTDTQDFQIRKVDFYDRGAEFLKTLTFTDYKLYEGKFWRGQNMHVVNHKTGKQTTLTWNDMTFGNGFSESDFSKASLKRMR